MRPLKRLRGMGRPPRRQRRIRAAGVHDSGVKQMSDHRDDEQKKTPGGRERLSFGDAPENEGDDLGFSAPRRDRGEAIENDMFSRAPKAKAPKAASEKPPEDEFLLGEENEIRDEPAAGPLSG